MDGPSVAELAADPHAALARLREHAPVAWVDALGGWLVLTRAVAAAVLRDPATFTVDDPRFSTRRVVGASMLTLDGPEHRRHRGPFEPAFRAAAVRARFADLVADECERLLGALAPAGAGDVRADFAGPLAVHAMAAALGLGDVRPAELLAWYRALVASVDAVTGGGEPTLDGAAAMDELRSALGPRLAARDGLTEDEVLADAAILLFGGIDTTEGAIANCLWHLLHNPPELAKVRARPELVPVAVEESLRLEPAASVVDRYATRDTELAGAAVGKGDLVRVSLAAVNRDPAHARAPDAFELDRPPGERRHLAFARGPHSCLGVHLARLEARVAVGTALARLPGLRADPARPDAPRGLVFRKPGALWVRWG